MKMRRSADSMTSLSPEQKRDTQKQRAGSRAGYRFSPADEQAAMQLAAGIVDREVDVYDVPSTLARNVWSALQTDGYYDLARAVKDAHFPSPAGEDLRSLVREMIEDHEAQGV